MPEQKGFEEAVLDNISQQLEPMSKAMASQMGMPPGGKKYTEQEQLTEWNYSPIADPTIRAQAMMELKQFGKTDEEITDAVYPNRRELITTSRPGIREQIAYARSMSKLMQKKAAEMGMSMPPSPSDQASMPAAAPEPMMPSPSPTTPEAPQAFAPEIASTAPAPQSSILDQPISSMMGG